MEKEKKKIGTFIHNFVIEFIIIVNLSPLQTNMQKNFSFVRFNIEYVENWGFMILYQ